MNPCRSTSSSTGNDLVRITTLITVVMAAIMVAAGVYGDAVLRRSQVVRPIAAPTTATTNYFDPCNVDHWGRDLPIQVKMQFRKQCVEHSLQ